MSYIFGCVTYCLSSLEDPAATHARNQFALKLIILEQSSST